MGVDEQETGAGSERTELQVTNGRHWAGHKLQGRPFRDISLWISVVHKTNLVTAFPRHSCDFKWQRPLRWQV